MRKKMSFRKPLMAMLTYHLASTCLANPQVTIPENCLDSLDYEGICVRAWEALDEPGSFDVHGYTLVYKDDFGSLEEVARQYFDFPKWQSYYQKGGDEKTRVIKSVEMALEVRDDAPLKQTVYRRNYFYVKTKIPIMGEQVVRAVAFYKKLETDPKKALIWTFNLPLESLEVPAGEAPLPNGPKGLKKQDGGIYFYECGEEMTCLEDEILVYYTARIRHRVPLMPQYAAKFTKEQIESLFTGMYLR